MLKHRKTPQINEFNENSLVRPPCFENKSHDMSSQYESFSIWTGTLVIARWKKVIVGNISKMGSKDARRGLKEA